MSKPRPKTILAPFALLAILFGMAPVGPCTEPAQPVFFLLARDGRQCVLQEEGSLIAQAEKARLEKLGVEVTDSWVSFLLRDDHLPLQCIPKKPERYFKKHPWAAEGVKESKGAVCEACGCPETWFFCIASTSPTEELKTHGYAPVN